jgi:hypothetical protein
MNENELDNLCRHMTASTLLMKDSRSQQTKLRDNNINQCEYESWEDILNEGPLRQKRQEDTTSFGYLDMYSNDKLDTTDIQAFRRRAGAGGIEPTDEAISAEIAEKMWRDFVMGEHGAPIGRLLGREQRKDDIFRKLRETQRALDQDYVLDKN